MKKYSALFLFLAFNICHADPYADDYNKNKIAHHNKRHAIFLKQVTYIYFAVGCEVFSNEGAVLPLLNSMATQVVNEDIADNIAPSGDTTPSKDAAAAGMKKSTNPNACDYWHKHPEEVYKLRQLADLAMRSLVP